MQKNLRLTVLVMALLSILLFILIIGPEARDAVAASNHGGNPAAAADGNTLAEAAGGKVDSLKPEYWTAAINRHNQPSGKTIPLM